VYRVVNNLQQLGDAGSQSQSRPCSSPPVITVFQSAPFTIWHPAPSPFYVCFASSDIETEIIDPFCRENYSMRKLENFAKRPLNPKIIFSPISMQDLAKIFEKKVIFGGGG
jgi:hypothetical protein